MPDNNALKSWSDRQVIDQIIQKGDRTLFGVLYDRYANKIYRKCIGMLKNRDDAQDLCHDILVKAFLNIGNFEGNSSFSTWVYAITYNQCIDYLRQKQKTVIEDFEDNDELFDRQDNSAVEEKQLFEISFNRLQELIYQLNEDDMVILLMKYQDEMSVDDIMKVLKISESAAKMRLKRARDRLRKLYEKKYEKL